MDHEAPGHPDLSHEPPLLTLEQWRRFCHAYALHTGNEYYLLEGITLSQTKAGREDAAKQWAAWLRWVAVYKLTGDGRGSFAAEGG